MLTVQNPALVRRLFEDSNETNYVSSDLAAIDNRIATWTRPCWRPPFKWWLAA